MTVSFFKKNYYFIFFLIILIGIFFRYFNLSWGSPFFFHPDERNIATSISQLSYPNQMNPHFFAYGSFPVYCVYFLGVFINFIQNVFLHSNINITSVSFENAIIIGRIFSFLLSCALLFILYLLGKIVGGTKSGVISVIFASLSVGFIQYAHFSTFEMWLSFFTLLLCFEIISYAFKLSIKHLIYSGVILGILMSIKISSAIFLPLCIFTIFILDFNFLKNKKKHFIHYEKVLLKILLFTGIGLITTYFTSPYFWYDFTDFLSSIHYESSVALGTLQVFYSQGFEKTIPIVYPLIKVYPFILNPIAAVACFIVLFITTKQALHKKNTSLIIMLSFFLVAFFSQAFLFVKWIRYYIPTISFLYLFLGIYLGKNLKYNKLNRQIVLTFFLILVSFIYSLSYFITVLYLPDTRIQASIWAHKNIPKDSRILSEVYDLGIVPFNQYFQKITLFNFYDLDIDIKKSQELQEELKLAQYIILPSQRILESRITKSNLFPKGETFYKNLINGGLGFSKIYETPCDIFCKILYLGSPSYSYEQTANVFDRPTILIFKKSK